MNEMHQMPAGERIDKLSDRARLWFSISVGLFVLVVSFFYGFAKGLSKNATAAHARASLAPSLSEAVELPEGINFPRGTTPLPIGKNVQINGKHVAIASFVSNRSIPEIVQDQLAIWSQKNLKLVQRVTERRAVVLGTDRSSGQKYSFMVWMVPPTLRRVVSQGFAVKGTLAISDRESSGAMDELPFAGEVPGVPVMPGGSGGAVFSSDDIGGRSHTGIYTNPGTLEDNKQFYRNELSQSGWQEVPRRNDLPFDGMYAQQHFIRGVQEITLLFSTPKSEVLATSEAKTVVTVILSGRMPKV